MQSGSLGEFLLPIHGYAYSDASGICCGSDDVRLQKISLDPQGDHVLTCKKHTGATRGHDHIVEILVALVRNSGDKTVRVNYRVSQTAADSRKQGNVEIVGFGLAGSSNLVVDVSV